MHGWNPTSQAFGFINLLPPGPAGVTAKRIAADYTVLHDCSGFTNALVLVTMLNMT